MTMQANQQLESFMDYWSRIEAALMNRFGIDTSDAGIEPGIMAGAQEEDWTPEEFALWVGEKYCLTPLS